MSITNLAGERIHPPGQIEFTNKTLDALRNLIVLELHNRGATLKQIAQVIGVHEATACRRLQKIQRQQAMERGEDG